MIKIYTYSHNRPDLIKPQYESFKRYIKDDFEKESLGVEILEIKVNMNNIQTLSLVLFVRCLSLPLNTTVFLKN